jgi:glyoxylase-like metal-dependent hydrolase (beta-lactamase superfamily II)
MRITTHGRYLVQLTRFPRMFPINSYLVREDDGLTLVDTTIASSAPAIGPPARGQGQPNNRIALTHAHKHHIGRVEALHQIAPMCGDPHSIAPFGWYGRRQMVAGRLFTNLIRL